jgi:hypothetical protein
VNVLCVGLISIHIRIPRHLRHFFTSLSSLSVVEVREFDRVP